jgi:hypothetical protein
MRHHRGAFLAADGLSQTLRATLRIPPTSSPSAATKDRTTSRSHRDRLRRRQTERDALVHRLRRIDDRLDDLSAERRPIVDELASVRGELDRPFRGATAVVPARPS